jgi:hypothetical protein
MNRNGVMLGPQRRRTVHPSTERTDVAGAAPVRQGARRFPLGTTGAGPGGGPALSFLAEPMVPPGGPLLARATGRVVRLPRDKPGFAGDPTRTGRLVGREISAKKG